tara:strand:+ start:1739 stop:3934 length:2196 start_codon:yes stop_codon:yes gene_type:complete
MVNYVSPGVYTVEKDISDYAPSINTSIVGIVGFASKGPTNKPTLITSQSNLIRTFGEPSEAIDGQAIEGALEILEQTNSMYIVRAASDDAADASATMSLGSCPAVIVSGNSTYTAGWGVASPLTLRVQVYNGAGVAQYNDNESAGKDFSIPAGTATSQAEAIRKIVGGGLDADKVGCFFDGEIGAEATGLGLSGAIVGSYAGSGASIGVSACSSTTFTPLTTGAAALRATWAPSGANSSLGVSGVYASSVRVYGSTLLATGTDGVGYLVESLHPGTGYNGGLRTNGDTSGNSITTAELGSQNFSISVNENGITDETFKCSFVGSGSFIEDVINTGETNTTSETIKGNLVKNGVDAGVTKLDSFTGSLGSLFGTDGFVVTSQWVEPGTANAAETISTATTGGGGSRFNKLAPTTATNLAGGDNGTGTDSANATALIGNASVEPKTGMQSLDDPVLNIGIALVPGIQNQSVQNNLITLAETTQNFLALVSPPVAVGTVQDAIDWSNGKSSSTGGSRTAAINSSYAAIYWPWVKVFSTFDGLDRWYDPAIYGARQMAYTDGVADSWFAPAGYRRGRLTKPVDVEVKLNQGDRDSLYSGGNVVNPIVAFPQQGITIFGQRTTQRSPTALDRINIRRLMIFIRKVILIATQRFVFEPNDEFTWSQIEGVLNPFLDDIRKRRGITEFRVVCDSSTNTPLRVDRNELWTKVLIKPTKTAEILIFEINLTNQSAQLGTL